MSKADIKHTPHRKRQEEWQAKLGTSALNPLEVLDLQEAIKAKKKIAVLQGRKFHISYYREEGEDKIHYKPVEGFTPCGFLLVKKIMGEF